MEKEFWLTKWESNIIGFHQPEVNPDLVSYINELKLRPGARISIPLCGKTKDMLWLAENGYHVVGIELSPIACNDFFTESNTKPQIKQLEKFTIYEHDKIKLFCGDWFDFQEDNEIPVEAVYDCKALIALPRETRRRYVNHLVACFGTKIKILLLALETSDHVQGPPFSVDEAEVRDLYGSYFNVKLLNYRQVSDIPANLAKKGYTNLVESVYLLSGKA